MTIEKVEVFRTAGKQFESIEAAESYRHDLVGEFFDKGCPVLCGPGDRLKVVQWMADNRQQLRILLDY